MDKIYEVMKVKELAKLLRIGMDPAYALVRENKIPGVKRIGKTYRISRKAVLAWLDATGSVEP